MSLQPGPVRPLFRALGYVIGPIAIIAGGFSIVFTVLDIVRGAGSLAHYVASALMAAAALLVGYLFLRAAITGMDPYMMADEGPESEEPPNERLEPTR